MGNRRGFTLIEILIAIVFLSIALLAMLWMNQASNKGAMDAYYEFLGFSLAQEPIEVFRGLGFDWAENYLNDRIPELPDYPLDWKEVRDLTFAQAQHPAEAVFFKRHIALEPVEKGGLRALRITVTVSPAEKNRVMAWLSRDDIKLESLIVEKPK